MSMLGGCVFPHPPLIMPEVGRGEERRIQATADACREAAAWAVRQAPDVIVVTSPHSVLYADYFHISPGAEGAGDFTSFGAPQLRIRARYDEAFVRELSRRAREAGLPAGTLGERSPALDHGTMIPLRFLQEAGYRGPIVRIGLSGLSMGKHYALGRLIAQTAALLGRRLIFAASGDLSHKLKASGTYGFAEEGTTFDARMQTCFRTGDFRALLLTPPELTEGAAECGLRSFAILAGALDRQAVRARLLSYEGPFGVGYGVATFEAAGRDARRNCGEQAAAAEQECLRAIRAAEDAYVRLARQALETFVRTRVRTAVPQDVPEELHTARAGAFVSLKRDGRLRGCIGTILPTRASLAEEIIASAIAAGTEDPRFPAVAEEELPSLVYDVDVLTRPEPIASEDALDVKRYGVIVESGTRRGLLLPDLAGVNTVEEQIAIARRKGNIAPHEQVQLYRFEVMRHV